MKVAIIGAGLVAKTFHIPAFQACEGVKITAIYDRKPEKAKALADAVGAEPFSDYDELLRHGDIDAVSICTRTDLHCQMAVKAARAGKNIFLEKPMAASEAEAKEILDETQKNGVTFMLGMLNRFRTETMFINERRTQGNMGDIYHTDVRWIRRRGIPSNGWFVQKSLSGGGAGIDIGVHAIDTAWYLMGCPEPIAVSAVTHSRLGDAKAKGLSSWGTEAPADRPMDVEETAVALVRFAEGKSMTVTVSWAINGPEEDFNLKVYGTKEGASLNPFVIYGQEEGYCADITPLFVRDDAWKEGFRNGIQHFVDCVQKGEIPITSAENCYKVQRIIGAMYASASAGREIILK